MTSELNSKEYISLRDYFDTRINNLQQNTDLKISNVEKAITIASGLMEKRLESMNEFREQLKDQATHFLSRDEFQIQHDRVIEDIKMLRESRAELQGKASMNAVYMSYVIAVIGFLTGIIGIVIHFI